MKTYQRVFSIVALLFLAACGDGPLGPEDFNINGQWNGSLTSYSLTMNITETDGRVTGSAVMGGLLGLTVTGTRTGANLSLTFSGTGLQPMNAAGRIDTEHQMTLYANGSGFNNAQIIFTKSL